ncbi:hypothetical protein AMK16_20080 [Streptomyces sp. CB00455]|uniref:GPP34 family phosphoprotein n=1 Tax=Streptomyces sp. CB00455 TaxID=1703927 RepID=UPI00093A311A|nr:GPP34 family phosphoprotein [Streptomyces sp. CB00455]OKK17696.1 hypothetical protein AMK16_20080 [Streptomyces sp. CB00455]
MTTPQDLLIIAMDTEAARSVEQGNLSLALAGAELIDLLTAGTIRLDDDLVVPSGGAAPADPLLAEAVASLVPQEPYESVDDWLWRRGRGLAAAYRAALEADGNLVRPRRRGMSFRAGHLALADSPARRRAADRLAADEPALVALAEALGLRGEPLGASVAADADAEADAEAVQGAGLPAGAEPDVDDDAVATVLAAVHDALVELEAVRQRRAIEDAAFDNVWRGPGG